MQKMIQLINLSYLYFRQLLELVQSLVDRVVSGEGAINVTYILLYLPGLYEKCSWLLE